MVAAGRDLALAARADEVARAVLFRAEKRSAAKDLGGGFCDAEALDQLHKAMKKIATDDFARHPKPIDLGELIRQKDRGFKPSCAYPILGDKTLIKTLLSNLYDNAIAACGSPRLVKSELVHNEDGIVLTISNTVNHDNDIDTDRIFTSGFTSEKVNGTGVGLSE